jgi:hypothetical protein
VGSDSAGSEDQEDDGSPLDNDEFVVEKLIGICYGGSGRKNGIYFKVLMCYFLYCLLGFLKKALVACL